MSRYKPAKQILLYSSIVNWLAMLTVEFLCRYGPNPEAEFSFTTFRHHFSKVREIIMFFIED